MFKTMISVRYSETDQMGIVHHSRYFPWFEVGRTELFREIGVTYAEIEQRGILLPLVNCNCKFISGARYGDDVWIEVYISNLSVAKCSFEYRVIRAFDDILLAEGATTHAFTDRSLKPINLKKFDIEVYEKLYKLYGGGL